MTRERDTYDRFQPPDRGRFGDNETRSSRPRVTGASDLIDIDLVLRVDPPKKLAIAVSNGQGSRAPYIWLPRSQIEYRDLGHDNLVRVTMPQWLAKEKGLV